MNKDEPLAHSARPEKGISAQTYKNHVCAVLERARENVSFLAQYFSGDINALKYTVELASQLHDLGKLDDDNQRILRDGSQKHLPINHVDGGAAYLLSRKRYNSAMFVYGHHGHSPYYGLCSIPKESIREQLIFRDENIYTHTNKKLLDYLAEHQKWCGEIGEHSDYGVVTGWTGLARRIAFSCFVDGDHGDTANNYGSESDRCSASPQWEDRLIKLNEYVKNLQEEDKASEERKKQRQETYEICRDADINPSLYACDSPVGTGKTTAVMAHMLNVAKENKLRHIFVVLPYTNIIKQSVDVYRKALVLQGEKPEQIIAEHHHQADFSGYEMRQYASLWNAPIIVTTAVQFFETLGVNNPARLRKLHELPGSAIFLDEAHAAIPTWLWPQAWCWVKELSDKWKCHFVFASGSLPLFWQNEKIAKPVEQIPNLINNEHRVTVNIQEKKRVKYTTQKEPFDLRGLVSFIESKKGPRLVVLNTVQSAAILAWKMRKSEKQVLHLSTALTPLDRNTIVEKIKSRLLDPKDKDWTLVATSCVEAGMNFSFASAFRESCTAASLIQIGGRVNRHGNDELSEVIDIRISDSLMNNNPQLKTSCRVLETLFNDKYFEEKNPTEIVTEAIRRELMSDFGEFEKKALSLKKCENTHDYPEMAKLCRIIDSDSRLVVVGKGIAEALRKHEKVDQTTLVLNSVQIRYFKVNSNQFKSFCKPINDDEEIFEWTGKYDAEFLGYMDEIAPLIDFNNKGYEIV